MISYKYKLYTSKRTKYLDRILREASYVWNHALALQKRYYRLFGKYISKNVMQKHFAKRISRNLLHSQSVQEILERLDTAFQRFFKRLARRPPKFRRAKYFSSFVFKQGGFTLNGNVITINRIKKRFKFSYSRPYEGKVRRIIFKRSPLGEFYLIVITDANSKPYGKTHDGASVGIDFGLKTYMVMSDGTAVWNPQYLKFDLGNVKRKSLNLSKTKRGSNNRERRRMELCREFESITNRRNDFQWKLAHELCRRYDYIFIEDLSLSGMTRLWGRKMSDLAHAEFVNKLEYVASKYGVTVHRIDRFYPSSKTCECGYVNKNLSLTDREWICPECGKKNDRDLNAAQNILRRGISELWSGCQTESDSAIHDCTQESNAL
ncbi:MAG: transposase [Muribaculaceae bacterium]|nr:transposase [Muribaculaceae bacterium]